MIESIFPIELVDKVAKIVHEKFQHDHNYIMWNNNVWILNDARSWELLDEKDKDVNRGWAIKILLEIFQDGE